MKPLLWAIIFFLLGSILTILVRERSTFSLPVVGQLLGRSIVAPSPTPTIGLDWTALQKQVLPAEGFSLGVSFEDLGPKLLESGAIDLKKFEANFAAAGGLAEEQKAILTQTTNLPIAINQKNAIFMVDFFWALGLVNKNRILEEGAMAKDRSKLGNFASTGGWTLGKRSAVDLFSKYELIKLTETQQEVVKEVAEGVFRPCCGNPTSFPDCNHGMAALGLAQYLAAKDWTAEQIFNALLKFNSFWFPQTYLDIAAYFQLQGTDWSKINSQLVLGKNYSSGEGYSRLKQELNQKLGVKAPSLNGGGCST